MQSAIDVAAERVRDGLPLRAPIAVVGYVARKPAPAVDAGPPDGGRRVPRRGAVDGHDVRRLYDEDVEELGLRHERLARCGPTCRAPRVALFGLLERRRRGRLRSTFRQRGILVAACASTLGDSYCSLAWGSQLAGDAGADLAGDVLRGDDAALDATERALARWARQVTRDPNATAAADVESLRAAGYDDAQIFAITLFVALRIAFSTVNDALGARPDRELLASVPDAVRDAVTFGRPAVS